MGSDFAHWLANVQGNRLVRFKQSPQSIWNEATDDQDEVCGHAALTFATDLTAILQPFVKYKVVQVNGLRVQSWQRCNVLHGFTTTDMRQSMARAASAVQTSFGRARLCPHRVGLHSIAREQPASTTLATGDISTSDWIAGEPPIARLGTDVGRMARDLNVLFKIAKRINSLRSVELFQNELLQLIGEVIPADSGAILLIRDMDQEPNSIVSWERQPIGTNQANVRREVVLRALWERSAVLADFASASGSTERVLCVPLFALQNTLGVIYLVSFHAAQGFPEDNVHLLSSVACIAAVTLENILLLESLQDENRRLRKELAPDCRMIGESKPLLHLKELIQKVAKCDSTVLVQGESGTGKDVVALAIHRSSARADGPFVAINCAAIPESLLESELFGYEKGAFTGAVASKRGKCEVAKGGTLFLDEVGELAPALQAKLLRVLQVREFERLGGTQPIKFDARVVAATNKELELAIKRGEFRRDLFYRLHVVSILVPPLRERRDDIPLLAMHFATKHAQRCEGRRFSEISAEARSILMSYAWPGNVRELENVIEHAIVMGSNDVILPDDLPEALLGGDSSLRSGSRYYDSIRQLKRQLILESIEEADGSYPEAAKLLGIHANYLHRLARNFALATDMPQLDTTSPRQEDETN